VLTAQDSTYTRRTGSREGKYGTPDMNHEARTTALIQVLRTLSEMADLRCGIAADIGCGFYIALDGSTSFYMTRFLAQNTLPMTPEFTQFVRTRIAEMSGGLFMELTD
jgi:hypothetical protein